MLFTLYSTHTRVAEKRTRGKSEMACASRGIMGGNGDTTSIELPSPQSERPPLPAQSTVSRERFAFALVLKNIYVFICVDDVLTSSCGRLRTCHYTRVVR